MFNKLAGMLSGQPKERRKHARKKMRFDLVWLRGQEQLPGVGTELSEAGCLIMTQDPPPADFDAILDLGRRKIRLRLHTVRSGTLTVAGSRWTGLGCTFSGIAADDYDTLVRVLKDIPESENRAASELAAKDKSDDAYRLLPLAVQQRILQTLSQHGRIEIPPPGQAPLLRMEDLGLSGGARRLGVHSRVITRDGPQLYDSVIRLDPAGNLKLES